MALNVQRCNSRTDSSSCKKRERDITSGFESKSGLPVGAGVTSVEVITCAINHNHIIIIIIDNRGLNTRWCLTPLLLSLPTVDYLGQRGLITTTARTNTPAITLTLTCSARVICYCGAYGVPDGTRVK